MMVQGGWLFPNGSDVGINGNGGSFYRDRGPSVVRLHRRNDALMASGVYHCHIPDSSGVTQNFYIGLYTEQDGKKHVHFQVTYHQLVECHECMIIMVYLYPPGSSGFWL